MKNSDSALFPFDSSIEAKIFAWLMRRKRLSQPLSLASLLQFSLTVPDKRIDHALTILNQDRENLISRLQASDSYETSNESSRIAQSTQIGLAIANACSTLNHDFVNLTTIFWAGLFSDKRIASELGIRIDESTSACEIEALFRNE